MLRILFTIFALVCGPVYSASTLSHDKFMQMSQEDQRKVVISIMEFVVELESKYQKEVQKTGFNQERFLKHSEFFKTITSLFFSEAHAARNVRYGQYLHELRGILNQRNACIYGGWISEMRGEHCTHPNNSRYRNLYQSENGCAGGPNRITCNPAIFGFKNVAQKTLFCVPAGIGAADNSSKECMKKALAAPPEEGASSKEDRLNNIIAGIAANPQDAEATFNFLLKACACEASAPQIAERYHNYMRPHQTCYSILRMMAEYTPQCQISNQPMMDGTQANFLNAIKGILSVEEINNQSVANIYSNKLSTLLSPTDYRAICGADRNGGIGTDGDSGTASSGASAGISSGASAGISSGASAGISSGASAGISSGASAGASSGASAGDSSGASAGASSGASAGDSSGASAGDSSGASAGISSGASAGDSSGASAGASSGASAGDSSGASAGVVSGSEGGTIVVGPTSTPGGTTGSGNNSGPSSGGGDTTTTALTPPTTTSTGTTGATGTTGPSGNTNDDENDDDKDDDKEDPNKPTLVLEGKNKDNNSYTINVRITPTTVNKNEYYTFWYKEGANLPSSMNFGTNSSSSRTADKPRVTLTGDPQEDSPSTSDGPSSTTTPPTNGTATDTPQTRGESTGTPQTKAEVERLGKDQTKIDRTDDPSTFNAPRLDNTDYKVCGRLIKKSTNEKIDEKCVTVPKKTNATPRANGNPFQQQRMGPTRGGSSDAIFRGIR